MISLQNIYWSVTYSFHDLEEPCSSFMEYLSVVFIVLITTFSL
jgi:hypothetical protein